MGETKTSSNGKSFPAKLEHWRITSPSAQLIEAAAEVYGGEPHTWDNPAGGGKEWEVYTEAASLRVVVPGGTYAFSQFYEQWSAGGCQRRCDGFTEQISGNACLCPADQDERSKAASRGGACKMTTRLSIILPDIPDIGTWMLESHGYYAAVELGAAEELIRRVTGGGTPVPAHLRIEQRTAKRGNETRRYAVPVLELLSVTHDMLTTGEVSPLAAIGNGAPRQVAAPQGARALEVGGAAAEARDSGESTPAVAPTGPAQPPLPHEIEGVAADPAPAATPSPDDAVAIERAQRVAIMCREAGLDDEGRHQFLHEFSGGAYSSAKSVPAEDLARLKAALVRKVNPVLSDQPPVVDVPLPDPNGTHDQQWWLARVAPVEGVGQARLLKAARTIAGELGEQAPGSLDAVTPTVGARLEEWIGAQG